LTEENNEYRGWLAPEAPSTSTDDPPPPTPDPQIPVWAPFLALAAALFIVLLIGGTAIALLAAADPDFESDNLPVGVTLVLTAFQNVVFVLAAYITIKVALGRTTREDFGLVRVRKVGEAVGWAALVYVGFWLITALLAGIFGTPDEQALVQDVKAEDSLVVLAAYAVTICLVAPVVEELFFRGFMFGALAKRLGPWWGMGITGVVFAVGHAPAPAISLVALGVFGVGLCLLYWRTQSIVPCMALHALNNAITFGVTKDLDPALFAAVVVGSVGVVSGAAQAFSSRRSVAA
jgi:membrane protease YdiL (CAAX protease family)